MTAECEGYSSGLPSLLSPGLCILLPLLSHALFWVLQHLGISKAGKGKRETQQVAVAHTDCS